MTMTHALKTIPVFYADAMLAAPDSYSPSAQKPRHVLAAWQDAGLPVTVTSFAPVDEADFGLAHDPTYVRDVLDCKTDNGFFNRAQDVADSLPYTTGAMLAAARAALKSGCACLDEGHRAPCQHHARMRARICSARCRAPCVDPPPRGGPIPLVIYSR
jgi:hypothetical protein